MKEFIELTTEPHGCKTIVFLKDVASIQENGNGTTIIWSVTNISNTNFKESYSEVIAKIDAARGEEITAELCRTTGANVYYRTADRLPTKEDADSTQMLLASRDLEKWFCIRVNDIENWRFWSPVPKVEVRG